MILKLATAWHQPVEIFIPSIAMDELTVEVVPASILKKDLACPSVVGDFNHFDLFDKVDMERNEDGLWTAEVETDQPIIHYKIKGFAQSQLIHGTDGILEADLDHPGITSSLEPDEDGIARILFDPGEDEEWHEAHFELVRSYPQSKRINYSYREGFAPESVVHIGRFFPDLAYSPLESETDSLHPADISSSLTILYFWSFKDPEFVEQIDVLESMNQRFSDRGIEIIPVALDKDRNRVERFHQHRHHSWRAGLDKITNPQIQVLGITNTPHTIFLGRNNRVLYHGESILEDDRLPDFVEDFYND